MGQDQLVAQLDISKPAVSRTLNSLEKKGYVTRQHDPHVKRAQRVRLTDKALKIGLAVEQAYNQIYRLAIQGISPQEFEFFVHLFARMSENFTYEQENRMISQNPAQKDKD